MKTMTKEFGNLSITKAGAVFTLNATSQGWRQLTPGGAAFITSNYFDLGGLAYDDKTLFFQGAAVQEVLPPSASAATPGDLILVVDLMSSVPLTDIEAASYAISANLVFTPNSTLSFHETIYGRVRIMAVDLDTAATGYYITMSDNQTGSLEPTASDRIYCYRIVSFDGNNSDGTHEVFGARYLLRADAKEESEYQYLMRLKRSYELQNQPDRD